MIKKFLINKIATYFSLDIFHHRVGSNDARFNKFDEYIDQYIKELDNKNK